MQTNRPTNGGVPACAPGPYHGADDLAGHDHQGIFARRRARLRAGPRRDLSLAVRELQMLRSGKGLQTARKTQIEVPMSRRLISTGSPFEKTAGYSRAVIDGDFAFVSGTTGYDYATMTMPADVTSQTRNCFKTIESRAEGWRLRDGRYRPRHLLHHRRQTMPTPCSRSAAKSLAISDPPQRCSSSAGSISPK